MLTFVTATHFSVLAAGAVLGFYLGLRIGKRRGADGIVDQMINAELAGPDHIDRTWPETPREGRFQ